MKFTFPLLLLAPLALAGCTTTSDAPPSPSGQAGGDAGSEEEPSAFEADERRCRAWADAHLDETPADAATDSTVKGAAAGTLLGASAGAAIGSTQGQVGKGALIGAASGLVLGTVAGASAGERDAAAQQRRYDVAYGQCMKSVGNSVELPQRRRVVVVEDRPAPVVVYGSPYYERTYYER